MNCPAKLNLYLHVTGQRPDGYHLLDSLAVFPNIGDTLTLAPSKTLSLAITGPFAKTLTAGPENLIIRAAQALAAAAGITPHGALALTKTLPVASGIGGGSTDAATALRLLARHWRITADLAAIAATLGADVPVCLPQTPARMTGIGEVLNAPPHLPDFGLVLVNPGIAVSTADVFRARTGDFSPPATLPKSWPSAAAMARDLAELSNDLEPPALAIAPVIGEVLAALRNLPGALLARMSGSGATCFALFDSASAAIAAAQTLNRPSWWSWAGGLYEPAPQDI
jgi:4-diphosphocytidyl-2-C-methyl-D-erythritol kinase